MTATTITYTAGNIIAFPRAHNRDAPIRPVIEARREDGRPLLTGDKVWVRCWIDGGRFHPGIVAGVGIVYDTGERSYSIVRADGEIVVAPASRVRPRTGREMDFRAAKTATRFSRADVKTCTSFSQEETP